jgi:hypothetical protein
MLRSCSAHPSAALPAATALPTLCFFAAEIFAAASLAAPSFSLGRKMVRSAASGRTLLVYFRSGEARALLAARWTGKLIGCALAGIAEVALGAPQRRSWAAGVLEAKSGWDADLRMAYHE